MIQWTPATLAAAVILLIGPIAFHLGRLSWRRWPTDGGLLSSGGDDA